MRCSIKKRYAEDLPDAPPPTKAFKSSEYQVCLDGTVIRKTRLNNVTNLHLAVTPQTKASSYAERNKGAFSKWEQMAQMARENIPDEEIAKETGYTVQYVRKRLQLLRKSGADIPIGRARVEERRKGMRKMAEELKKQGKTYREIHEETGLALSTIRRYLGSPKK